MYETLQLMGSVVAGGFIIVIGIWVAWLMGASIRRQRDGRHQIRNRHQFDEQPFDERPFNRNDYFMSDKG